MDKFQRLDRCIWKTIDGRHIPIYNDLSLEESIEITSHYNRIQSIVDDYPKKFPLGKNTHIIDGWNYKFLVSKAGRKVVLISRRRYDGRYDDGY